MKPIAHTGFKLTTTDLFTIHRVANEFSVEMEAAIHEKESQYLAQAVTEYIDRLSLGIIDRKPKLGGPLIGIHNELLLSPKIARPTSKRKNPFTKFEFTLTLFPVFDNIIGTCKSSHSEFVDAWMEKRIVTPYTYQPHSFEGKVPSQEWQNRQRDWETILNKPTTGFTIQCIHKSRLPEVEEILKHIPNVRERAKRMARDQLYKTNFMPQLDNGDSLKSVLNFNRWLETSNGRKEVATLATTLQFSLIPTITKDHLLSNSVTVY